MAIPIENTKEYDELKIVITELETVTKELWDLVNKITNQKEMQGAKLPKGFGLTASIYYKIPITKHLGQIFYDIIRIRERLS